MSTQDVYIATIKSQLDELNAQLKKLEAGAGSARRGAQKGFDDDLAVLREKSRLAGAKLDEMKHAAADRWHTLVVEMEKLRDAFTHAFHHFKSQV
jgi:uncharacterized alpha-E superfamily protein